jgi:hypothetical protein
MVKGGISRFLGGFNYSDWTSTEWRSLDTDWSRSVPSDGHEKVAPITSPTSWYTAHDKVQHIAYVGSNHEIDQCFLFVGGFGGWHHEVSGAGRPKVAPGTSPTSWYTTPENVQHIAYVGNNADIHELFFFVRVGGDHIWHHKELIRSFVARAPA